MSPSSSSDWKQQQLTNGLVTRSYQARLKGVKGSLPNLSLPLRWRLYTRKRTQKICSSLTSCNISRKKKLLHRLVLTRNIAQNAIFLRHTICNRHSSASTLKHFLHTRKETSKQKLFKKCVEHNMAQLAL